MTFDLSSQGTKNRITTAAPITITPQIWVPANDGVARNIAENLARLGLPVALIAAVGDDAHVAAQREIYRARREVLRPALEGFGLRIDDSEAGLYLWATADEDCWDTLDRLCAAGILVAPGAFYGAAGRRHVRVALTAADERIATAVERLTRRR